MITKDTLSIATLLDVLKAAFVEASVDGDGDIVTREDYRAYIQVPSGAECIRFLAQFSSTETATRDGLLSYANRVNAALRVPRAYLVEGADIPTTGKRAMVIDEYVYVDAGLEEASFISSLRRFHRALRSVVEQDSDNVMA
jgi:Putative bacterial sensory transduction regulator